MFPLLSGWPVRYRQRVIPFLSAPLFVFRSVSSPAYSTPDPGACWLGRTSIFASTRPDRLFVESFSKGIRSPSFGVKSA